MLLLLLLRRLQWKAQHPVCQLMPGSSWGPPCHQLPSWTAVQTYPAGTQQPRLPRQLQPPQPLPLLLLLLLLL
jgi:hypothetical protein